LGADVKTPEELVEELELAARDSFAVSLFVGFEDSSILLPLYHSTEVLPDGRVVYERDPNFLSVLKEAIANGGVPIGWYRLKTKETAGDIVELGPLHHQKEPWVYEYLMHFFSLQDKERYKAKYYLVYPDGDVLDITNVE
jgi:hypothetical protein